MNQPPWMPYAWADIGQHEIAGSGTNPRIAAYFRLAGHPEITDDETAWCAAFVGACLEQAEIRSSRSLAARSYLAWGIAAAKPEIGCITVLSRGGDPSLGHVGFLVGLTETHVQLLGGNQSDSVSVATFDRSRVVGFRLPASMPATAPSSSRDASPRLAPRNLAPQDLAPQDLAPQNLAPQNSPSATAGFDAALALVLEFEGGWSDDPFDPGGATNKGITIADFAREQGAEITAANIGQLKARLRRISDSEVRRIYLERYWQPACCLVLPPPIALFHFDCAVNQGLAGAARMLQEALGVAIDGDIGPLTRDAANSQPPTRTIDRYADIRRRRYRGLSTFWRFGRGWLRRVDAIAAAAHALATAPPRFTPTSPPRPRQKDNGPMLPQATDASTRVAVTPAAAAEPAAQPDASNPAQPAKWWGESLTIWGALLTGLTTVAPAVFAAFGIDISADLLQRLGGQATTAIQAVAGLIGTLMTIYGRARATTALQRRTVSLHL